MASAPPRGRFAEFEIDFARFAPNPPDPDPTTYYVRVVALDSRGNWVGQPSPSIMLSYGTPRVIRMPGSRIQLMPRPLSVTVELENFRVHNVDEDGFLSNGDEPYLFVVAVFADGATIRIDDLVHSTVRLASCTRAHDNLNANHVDAGYSGPVPAATGSFTASMLPIDDGGLGIGGALARAAVVVVAMEEDGTSNSAARAGLRAFVDTLQTELNRAVQRSLGRVNEDAVQERVESAVREAIKDETLTWNVFNLLSGVVDPDDYIGAAFIQWSLTDIAAAGSEGIPIEMHLRKSGVHYEITGRVTGR